jgi:hypothetical protein
MKKIGMVRRSAASVITRRRPGVRSQFMAPPANSTAQRNLFNFAAASSVLTPPNELPATPI